MKSPVSAIEELVRVVADSASRGKLKATERLEALRVLAPYYAAMKKARIAASDSEVEEITINRLQHAVKELEDSNGQAVPDHQRGRGEED
jgi:hypothetical protein